MGVYPVLEALGIADRVSPMTRSHLALYTVQAGSYVEAVGLLAERGSNDIEAPRVLLKADLRDYAAAALLAQQVAEKMIKALWCGTRLSSRKPARRTGSICRLCGGFYVERDL